MSTIRSIKMAMGWTSAVLRSDTCRWCRHFEIQGSAMRCKKGDFYTSPLAVCEQHEADLAALQGADHGD